MIPVFSILQVDSAHTSIWQPIVDFGFLGLDSHLLLTDHTVSNGNVVYKAVMEKDVSQVYSSVEFLTFFSATRFDEFYSDYLEQLAKACPNLQQLNLTGNVNCLKRLRGLCAIAIIVKTYKV